MKRSLWFTTTAVATLVPISGVLAQAPAGRTTAQPSLSTTNRAVYQAAYFAQFAPRTAFDIAQHVPGFTLDLGSTQTQTGTVDVRGFAGTAGNVVINGARPSTKAETLDITLQRIPAQRVVRVEVSPGDAFGSDYAGKSQVLNIIMSDQAGIDADFALTGMRRYTGYINRDASASAIIRHGASSISLAAGMGRSQGKQYEEGTDTLTDRGTGEVVEFRRKHNIYFNQDPYLSAGWSLERALNKAIRFNVRWQPSRFDLRQDNRDSPVGAPAHDDNLFQHYRDPVLEIAGDVTRPLAGGAIKFVVLETRRKRHDLDTYLGRNGLVPDGGAVNGGYEQLVAARRNETIGRLSWTRQSLWGMSFEAGAEAAYNTLASNVDFSAIEANGEHVPIPLPIAKATVKEKRAEVYFSLGKTLGPTLRLDGGANYETSTLKVRGDAIAERSLQFLKPNLAIDWKPAGGWHARLSVRRTVAQLDFYDFISTADLSAQRVNGGNANLQPQRSWELRAVGEHPLFGTGLTKLELGYDLVSKLQDRILLFDGQGAGLDSPGNLGTGRRYYVELTADAPLDRLWNGLHVKFDGTIQHTSVKDPINGQLRKWSGYYPDWLWSLDIRRDSGRWSFGTLINDNQRFTFYRTDIYDTNFNGGPFGTLFVEFRPRPATTLRLDVDNLFQTSGNRDLLRFTPNRAVPAQIIDEARERNRHLSFGFTLKQSFDGGGGGTKVAKSQ